MILKDDVTAAIRRAFQLGQTYWQQADSESYKENKKADATRDRYNALCIETAEIAARADTRIAELERECLQWRDELRIYRETENKRIAELESEVARLRDALDQSALEYADLAVSAKSLEEHLSALVEVSDDSTIARARAVLNGDDIGEDEDTARAGNGGGA